MAMQHWLKPVRPMAAQLFRGPVPCPFQRAPIQRQHSSFPALPSLDAVSLGTCWKGQGTKLMNWHKLLNWWYVSISNCNHTRCPWNSRTTTKNTAALLTSASSSVPHRKQSS